MEYLTILFEVKVIGSISYEKMHIMSNVTITIFYLCFLKTFLAFFRAAFGKGDIHLRYNWAICAQYFSAAPARTL